VGNLGQHNSSSLQLSLLSGTSGESFLREAESWYISKSLQPPGLVLRGEGPKETQESGRGGCETVNEMTFDRHGNGL
jgi:hypothetical protein